MRLRYDPAIVSTKDNIVTSYNAAPMEFAIFPRRKSI